ncbi:MFS transporter [Kineococcus sp. SYSU DK003]|uniref:MFS transporter n=1 Tax=Kineococcus sp. SYSU DK003 TaxID=3383124 RepID=UPI003D7C77E0
MDRGQSGTGTDPVLAADRPPTATRPEQAPDEGTLRRVTGAGLIGSFVEWYDYGIYGLLVGTLSVVLMPPGESASTGVLLTYAGFLVSFLVRPFGGVICGHLGDRIGRKRLLAALLLMISAATAAIGLIPDFATIGWAAPALLVLMRLVQGFSAGGEASGAMSFVAEYAPEGQRGRRTAWLAVGSFTALLFGSLLSSALLHGLSAEAMNGWGWRIPFLVAVPLGLVGFYIRTRLEDTPRFLSVQRENIAERNPLKAAFTSKRHLKAIGLTITLPALNGPGYYILFVYMPTYLKTELGFTQVQGLLVTAAGLVAIIAAIPVLARVSDRVGRKPVLIGSALAMAVLAYPAFLAIQQGQMLLACVSAAVLALAFAGHAAVIHVTLVEMFPTNVRYSAYSVGFNITTVVFGGSAPLVMTAIINATGVTSVPAFAVVLTALITLVTALGLRETAGERLSDS